MNMMLFLKSGSNAPLLLSGNLERQVTLSMPSSAQEARMCDLWGSKCTAASSALWPRNRASTSPCLHTVDTGAL